MENSAIQVRKPQRRSRSERRGAPDPALRGTGLGYQVATTGFLRWGSDEDPVVPEAEKVNRAKPGETNPLPQEPVAVSGGTPSYPDCPADFDWMESLSELFACESKGREPAQLNLIVEWDQTKAPAPAADGSGGASLPLTVEGSVSGKEVIWLGLPLESINSEFKIENDEVIVSHAEFVGMGGEFGSAGVYDIATSRLTFHSPISTMDPILLLRNLQIIDPSEWPAFDFGESMPELVGDELRIDFNELSAPIISMSIDAPGGFSFREHAGSTEAILVDSFRGNVEFRRPGELSILDIKTRSGGLDVTGEFTYLWDATRAAEPDGAGQATISEGGEEPKASSPPNSAEPSSRFSLTMNRESPVNIRIGGRLPPHMFSRSRLGQRRATGFRPSIRRLRHWQGQVRGHGLQVARADDRPGKGGVRIRRWSDRCESARVRWPGWHPKRIGRI